MGKEQFTYNDIYEAIREYHWMILELERLKKQFGHAWALEASSVSSEGKRQQRKIERARKFERQINFINESRCIVEEKERVILDCLLDGMKNVDIAALVNYNPKTIERIRDRIILKIYESQALSE